MCWNSSRRKHNVDTMIFSNEQLERYARNIALKEIGVRGQEKLAAASVLIIGAGGLGSPAAMYLAAAGVGRLGIADADVVDRSNLQRQILHTTYDLGKPKVLSARETLHAINPDVEVVAYQTRVGSRNILELISGYDFVLDATDNFAAKYLINDACVMAGKPFTYAGILRFNGQLMTVIPRESPCLRCVFPTPPPNGTFPSGRETGVIGAMAGIRGSIQAMEAVKYITGAGELLTGKLLIVDALTMEFLTASLSGRNTDCPVCSAHPSITELTDRESPDSGISPRPVG